MKVKRIMLIVLVLLAVLTIGAVSASDDADFNDVLAADNVDEVSLDASVDDESCDSGEDELAAIASDGEISEDNDVISSTKSDVFSDGTYGGNGSVIIDDTNSSSAGNGTDVPSGNEFELMSLIENANERGTIVLDKDYVFTGPIHDDTSIGISINKALTIDGQGHTINANGHCTIFAIDHPYITLANIIFINGHVSDDYSGGALGGGNSNFTIDNCVFANNTATDTANAGAIAILGDNFVIINSLFENNTGYGFGGAIDIRGNNAYISNCIFRNNKAYPADESETQGGAIRIEGESGNITACIFNNNVADLGSDMYIMGMPENFGIEECDSDAAESSIYFDEGDEGSDVEVIIFIDEDAIYPIAGEDVDDGFVSISLPSEMDGIVV